jgi:3-dehydroquinate synthase
MAKIIHAKTSDKKYPIIIGNDSLNKVVETLNKSVVSKCLIISDKNVLKYHSLLIRKSFALLDCKIFNYTYQANEKNKCLSQTEKIYKYLNDNSFDRNSVVIALGGGITGDIAGYAASTFMRGIKFIQIPTTLLSMVDSSVGGKTGVNFNQQKNLIGTFYQPELVAIYPDFLSTLPRRELLSGAGEVFKYSFLADNRNYKLLRNSLEKLFSKKPLDIKETIQACLKIKTSIVESDEKEITGLRKILNLGHTFAHSFETETNYKLKHGEAVIGGIFCSLFLSEILGYMSKEKVNKILDDFYFIKPSKKLAYLNLDSVYSSMSKDKKSSMGKKRFVILEDIGNIVVDAVADKSSVISAIKRMQKLSFL